MKKVLAIVIALALVMSVGITAFAAPNGFISSPTRPSSTTLVDFTPVDEDCDADVNVVPYSERDKLPDEHKKDIEDAYNSITNSNDISSLNKDLEKLLKDKGLDSSKTGVLDLFGTYYSDCDSHAGHDGFNLTVQPENLKDFVALLRYNNGAWELVNNAQVKDGKYINFTDNIPYVYAIIVNSGALQNSPQTGNNSSAIIALVAILASASGLVVILKKSKVFVG